MTDQTERRAHSRRTAKLVGADAVVAQVASVAAARPERTPDGVIVPFRQLRIADFDRIGGTMLEPDDTGKVVIEDADLSSRIVLWEDEKGLHGIHKQDGWPITYTLDNREATIGSDSIVLVDKSTPDLALGSSYDPAQTFIFSRQGFGTPADQRVSL